MVAERARFLQLLRKGASFMMNRGMTIAFASWRGDIAASASAKRQRESMSKALRYMLNRGLSRGWVAWHSKWEEAVRKRESLRRGLSHMLNRKLSAGWNSWVDMMTERETFLQLLRKGVSFMVNRELASGFMRWQRSVAGDAAMGRGLRHMMNRELSKGWRAWVSQWEEVLRKREALRRGLRHMLNRKLSAGWNSWAAMIAERREAVAQMRMALFFMLTLKTASGFSRWREFWHEATAHLSVGKRALRHMLNRKLSAGWSSWRSQYLEAVRQRDSARSSLKHMLNRGLSKGWRAWLAQWEEASNKLAAARRGLSHMLNRQLSMGWRGWMALMEEVARKRETAGRGLSHMMNRKLSAGWNSWAENVTERREALASMAKAAGYLGNRPLAMAWGSWLALVLGNAHASYAAQRGLSHLINRKLSAGWNSWYAMAAERREAMSKMRRGLSSLINRKLSAGWNSWAEMIAERQAAMDLMRRGLSFMVNSKLAAAFNSWRGDNAASASAQRQRDSMWKALRYMLHRGLSRGWTAWSAQYLEAVRKRDSARSALKHMMNRGLSKGWRGLEAMMTERREAMDLMRLGLSFMVNAKLVAAFNSWRGVDSGAQIAQRGLLYMLHRESLRGFRAWVQHFHTGRARGALVLLGLAHRTETLLCRGWDAWAVVMLRRRLEQRGLAHQLSSSLARALRAWRGMLGTRYDFTAGLRRADGHMARVLLQTGWAALLGKTLAKMKWRHSRQRSHVHWMLTSLRRAVPQWRHFVAQLAVERAEFALIVAHVSGPHAERVAARLGWNRWLQYVVGGMRLAHLRGKARARAWMNARASALHRWSAHVVEDLRAQQARRRALSHFVNRGLSACWRSWAGHVAFRSWARQIGTRGLSYWRQQLFGRAWEAWRELYAEYVRTWQNGRRAHGYCRRHGKEAALHRWQRYARERRAIDRFRLRLAGEADAHFAHCAPLGALARWAEVAEARARSRALDAAATSHHRRCTLRNGVEGWAVWVLEGKALFHTSQRLIYYLVTRYMLRVYARFAQLRAAVARRRAADARRLARSWRQWRLEAAGWLARALCGAETLQRTQQRAAGRAFERLQMARMVAALQARAAHFAAAHRFGRPVAHWRAEAAWRGIARRKGLAHGFQSWARGARARRALIARNLRAGPAFAAYFKHWRDEVPLRRAARLLMRQRNRTLQAAATVHHATVLARYGVTVWATHWKHELRRERAILQKRHDRLARGFGWLQGRRLRMSHLRVSQAFWRHRAHVVGWNAIVRAGIRAVKGTLLGARSRKEAAVFAAVRGWNGIVRAADRGLRLHLLMHKGARHHRQVWLREGWEDWMAVAARGRFGEAQRRQRVYTVMQRMLRAGRRDARERLLTRVADAHAGAADRRRAFAALGARWLARYLWERDRRVAVGHYRVRARRAGIAAWRRAAAERKLRRAEHAARRARAEPHALSTDWTRVLVGTSWVLRGARDRARGAAHRRWALRRAGTAAWRAWAADARLQRMLCAVGDQHAERGAPSKGWERLRLGWTRRAAQARHLTAAAQHALRKRLRLWHTHADGVTLRTAVQYRMRRFVVGGCVQAWKEQARRWRSTPSSSPSPSPNPSPSPRPRPNPRSRPSPGSNSTPTPTREQAQLWRRKQNVLARGLPAASAVPGMTDLEFQGQSNAKRNSRRRLWRGWQGWVEAAAHLKIAHAIARTAHAHARRAALQRLLDDWGVWLRGRRAAHAVAVRGIAGAGPLALTRGWQKLTALARRDGALGAKVRAARRAGAVGALKKAVRAWRRDAALRGELEGRVRRGRARSRGFQGAWREWRARSGRAALVRTLGREGARRLPIRTAAAAVRAWARYRASRRAHGAGLLLLARAEAFHERRIVRLALRAWVRRRDARAEGRLHRARARLFAQRCAHARWARVALKQARKQRRFDAAVKVAGRQHAGAGPRGRALFRAWAAMAAARRAAQHRGAVLDRTGAQFHKARNGLPAFNSWRRACRQQKLVLRGMVKGYARRRERVLLSALEWWFLLAYDRSRAAALRARAAREQLRLHLHFQFRRWAAYQGVAPLYLEADAFFEARALSEGWDAWVEWMRDLRLLFHSSASGLPSAEQAASAASAPGKQPLAGPSKLAGPSRPGPGPPRQAWAPLGAMDSPRSSVGSLDSPRSLTSPGRKPPARPTMRFH